MTEQEKLEAMEDEIICRMLGHDGAYAGWEEDHENLALVQFMLGGIYSSRSASSLFVDLGGEA